MGGSVIFQQDRYFVQVYWQGEKVRIWKYNGEPLWHRKTAEKLLNKIRSEFDDKTFNPKSYFPDSPMSLKEYAQRWVEIINVRESTRRDYRNSIRNHIIPYFRDRDIRTIRYIDLEEFYRWIDRKDKGKFNVMGCLKTIFKWAYKNEDIEKMPPFPRVTQGENPPIDYLTLEEQEMVLAFIPENHKPIFQIGMEYGLRTQEVRALMWDCICKNSKGEDVIRIKRSFSLEKLQETTKTNRQREDGITPYARDILKSIKVTSPTFIFVREDRKPYTGKDMNRIWKEACEKAGIRKIKLYNGMRHSLGCQMDDMGVPRSIIQNALGHTRPEMTDRYTKRSGVAITQALIQRRAKVLSIDHLLTNQNQ